MQTAYQVVIVALTSMLVINALYKNIDEWFRLREFCEEEELENLQESIKSRRGWINRHLLCAIMGVALVSAIKLTPSLEEFDLLAYLFGAHIIFSLFFAFVESLFAQRIAYALNVRMALANTPVPQLEKAYPPEGKDASLAD